MINSLPGRGGFHCLLTTFANSMDPDQDRQNVGPVLDPNCLTLWKCSWENFWKKLILKNVSRRQKIMKNYQACKEVMCPLSEMKESIPASGRLISIFHHVILFLWDTFRHEWRHNVEIISSFIQKHKYFYKREKAGFCINNCMNT